MKGRKRYRGILLLWLLIVTPTLCGCSPKHSKRELNNIAIILGLGLDRTTSEDQSFEDGPLTVTAQVARPASIQAGGSQNSGDSGSSDSSSGAFWNITLQGTDISPILRGSVQQVNRDLYMSHNQVIIFGEDLAKDGIDSFMDYFFRDREMRYNVLMAVGEKPAADLLKISPSMEALPSQEISKLLQIQKKSAEAPITSLFSFAVDQKSARKAGLMPLLNSMSSEEEDAEKVYVNGCAVFRNWKMVGKMNTTETRGMLWASGKIESTDFTVPVEDIRVSLEVIGKKGDMSVEFREDNGIKQLYVEFDISANAVISHLDGNYSLHQKDGLHKIEKSSSDFIADEVCAAISQSRKLECDIFGISDYVEKHMPDVWDEISEEWDRYFAGITYKISVSTHVRRTGSLVDHVLEREGSHE